jgi:peptidoglycan/xylan/chitin deacetylase (PgdA/CDA1 family)
MAREVDYVSPMVYPSHWAPQEYGVEDPERQPYAIVRRSLLDFRRAVRGSGARVVPWLQDFSLGVEYGDREVRAQIDATRAAGIDEYLLWDPRVTYAGGALTSNASLPTVGSRATAPGSQQLVKLPASRSPDDPVPSGLEPNELGVVPVLMYHRLQADGGGEYDITPAEFRTELTRLYRDHYRPVTASALVTGKIDLPRGASPVVLTFDDSSSTQAALLEDGRIDPDSAVGIMLDFARDHPDFRPAGTFYVNREPFGDAADAAELAQRLVALGFELGNHTLDHARLDELPDEEVQREIVLGNRLIRELVPEAKVETIALPFGLLPINRRLALAGSWDGESYRFAGAFLAGAEPSPSPYADDFDAQQIPRIRTDQARLLNGSADWLGRLEQSPELRYVSDGKP